MPTLEDVKKFLEENKENEEVQSYLNELSAVSADKVNGFLDTEEGKRLIQPRLDSHFTKGLDTWKANNLDALVDAKVKELYPEETEEQKRIRKLEKELEDQKTAAQREKLLNKAVSYASEKQLPADVVEFFIGEDEESTMKNLGAFEEKYNAALQKAIESKFQENGRDIQSGSNEPTNQDLDISSLAAEASIRK
ncbi:alanyl-tRNA synthetase [Bacillus amyloliquefaciens]|nr:alanyl-tRNA synthetase [Bacillus amyloliquefaciens]